MKNKTIFYLISSLLLVYVINLKIISIVIVNGDSMTPLLKNGQFVLMRKIKNVYERFDVIVFKRNNITYVKRIVGLPNESVKYKDNCLLINNTKISENFPHTKTRDFSFFTGKNNILPNNCYIVMGDNRDDSIDSRGLGFIRQEEIIGKIIIK